ncbi:MAG: prepilin-type N-terminal cleavage/methylation domain-containing protein [Deltaproteobacteria bacterium]|jgi:prepilin-type N-terminal cleavage/methylation domain-containing protein|nr:prepilin-type N-terminal cleavage/methylation domain-containing protein [Deltaproteobacteria bacterium]
MTLPLSKAKAFGDKPGLTLVELLTVILLGAILISMALLIYITTSRSYVRQDSLAEQMLNLRSAITFISRDMRMAGNGYSLLGLSQNSRILAYTKNDEGDPVAWFRYDPAVTSFGVQPVWFDGHSDAPDVLTVSYLAPEFSAPLGRLESAYSANDSTLRLDPASIIEYPSSIDHKEVLAPRDNLAVVNNGQAVVLESKVDASAFPNVSVGSTPSSFPPGYLSGGSNFPEGSLVYNVRRLYVHSFRVDTSTDSLVMDTLQESNELLAEGIEDLQVAFAVAKADPTVEANLVQGLTGYDLSKPENVLKVARIVLVSKSLTRDPYLNEYPRIQALDHKPVGSDPFRRRALESIVSLRNF